jgi:hypothetical protein
MDNMEVQHINSVDPANPFPAYRYKPLEPGTIRLLSIRPRDQGDIEADGVVHCSLQHVSLDKSPEYTAISYVWGPPEPSRYISLDGYKTKVTATLRMALHMINNTLAAKIEDIGLLLWIDALCIYPTGSRFSCRPFRWTKTPYQLLTPSLQRGSLFSISNLNCIVEQLDLDFQL